MKKCGLCFLILLALALGIGGQAAGQSLTSFTPGDLVVYRVGDGTTALSSASAPVFVDEYTPNGVLVGSLPMPTADTTNSSVTQHSLTASGSATSEGLVTVSSTASGQYITLTGYDAAPGTAKVASSAVATTPRTVGVVTVSNAAIDTTTALTNVADGNNVRSAVYDGTNIWVGGAGSKGTSAATGGVQFAGPLGSSTAQPLSSSVTDVRQVNIFGGQLYASSDSGKNSGASFSIGTVGTGSPTTGSQTITQLPGLPAAGGEPYQFFLADLDPNNGVDTNSPTKGVDTLYIADDGSSSGTQGGISKYSFIAGTWTFDGTVGTPSDAYRGLTGIVQKNSVILFATQGIGSMATPGGQIVSLIDSSGYGGELNSSIRPLGAAANLEVFRGIGIIPTTNPILFTGDFNLDLHMDVSDLQPMLQALANPDQYESQHDLQPRDLLTLGDVNHDGIFNNADAQAYLTELQNGGGSLTSVPEPCCLVLAGLSAIGLCVAGRTKPRKA